MEPLEIRYRCWQNAIPPQPIKLKIPGWAGTSKDHSDGSKPQPWHCPPFLEGSTYGLELLYPFNAECRVTNVNGKSVFEGEWDDIVPFEAFAPGHYGFTSSLDIVGPPGYVIRVEPHPCYFTDETWTTPCVVPGHLQTEWWPRIFFIVFKIPPPGQMHVFRKHQPYAQILVLPKKIAYNINPMKNEEIAERANLEHFITNAEKQLAENTWVDHIGHHFNDKYKVMSRIFQKEGCQGVKKFITDISEKKQETAEEKQASIRCRMKRRLVPHEKLQNKTKS